ncbi:hypothetical protein [Parablautia sp. Marseille-Q6255]|uniref:hypothetical protein n=1 Tax=Parablautia sp. Marseille-Q6255 TaxID=3039593 RepID=UPI0024BD4447|nr:hypothetical protein [Parablautia sp. Marseille-Q6255]
MIKEYIEKIFDANEEERKKYEEQMNQLSEELKKEEEELENLQKEKSIQINIFSPRNIDDSIEDKVLEKRNRIADIRENIENAKKQLASCIEKKTEYELLQKEMQSVQRTEAPESNVEECESTSIKGSNNIAGSTDKNTEGTVQKEKKNLETDRNNEEPVDEARLFVNQVEALLHSVYKRNEVCLALLNSDKNKCKSEMLKIQKDIKTFSTEMMRGI